MYATRVLAGLIAGALGTVAGGAAVAVAIFVRQKTTGLDPASLTAQGAYKLAAAVFVPAFLVVMVAVFRGLERLGLVGEPPTSRSPLGLFDVLPVTPTDAEPPSQGKRRA